MAALNHNRIHQLRTSSSNSERVKPQVAMLVDRDVLNKFPPQYKEFIEQTMGTFIFADFCTLQIAKIENDIKELMFGSSFSNEDTVQLCEDMRLVRRFWTDLQRFAEELQQNNRAQQ